MLLEWSSEDFTTFKVVIRNKRTASHAARRSRRLDSIVSRFLLQRLPLNDGEPLDTLEVGVARRKRHIAFERDGGNPDIIFRDDLTFGFQCHGGFGVAFRGGAIGIKQRGDLQEVIHELSVVEGMCGLFRAFVEFAEGNQRQEQRLVGWSGKNIDSSTQMGNDGAGVEQDTVGAISHALGVGEHRPSPAQKPDHQLR